MAFRVIEKCVDLHDYELQSIKELGAYATRKEAVAAACEFRDGSCFFEAWCDAKEGDDDKDEPPFCSWDVFNPDEDDGYEIFIQDTEQEQKENEKKIAKILSKEGKSKKKVKKNNQGPAVFGKCNSRRNRVDANLFLRNPSRLDRAIKLAPDAFPGGTDKTGFVDLIRRTSNAMYACKTVACDELGVEFTFKKAARVIHPSLIWIPESNLEQHSGDPSIIDTMHTDLIDNTTGTPRARISDVAKWCSPDIKHCMLNKFGESGRPKDYPAVAKALKKCTSLETFSASEWNRIPACVFEALKTAGPTLKGIHLMACELKDKSSYDALVDLVASSPNLVFLGLDLAGNFQFTTSLMDVLPASLKVLFLRYCGQCKEVDLSGIKRRCPNLKLRLVFPDKNFNSK